MIFNFFSEADTFLFPENGRCMCFLAVEEKLCFEAVFLMVIMEQFWMHQISHYLLLAF